MEKQPDDSNNIDKVQKIKSMENVKAKASENKLEIARQRKIQMEKENLNRRRQQFMKEFLTSRYL